MLAQSFGLIYLLINKLTLLFYYLLLKKKQSYNPVELLDDRKEGLNIVLFEESKRKMAINAIDLLTYMRKLYFESKIFTFTNDHLQTKISRVLFTLKLITKFIFHIFIVA